MKTLTDNKNNKRRVTNKLYGTNGMFLTELLSDFRSEAVGVDPYQLRREVKASIREMIESGELKETMIDGKSFLSL